MSDLRSLLISGRTSLLIAIVLLLLHTTVLAATKPDVVVREIFVELLDQIDTHRQANTLTRDNVRQVFSTLLNPRIDYQSLARWILGTHWSASTDAQRTEFLSAFENYIINTYALALANGQKIKLDVSEDPVVTEKSAIVSAKFTVEDADAVPLEFRLIVREDEWYLFDVAFAGVSLARTFRSDFTYVANNGGIDAVTTHLVNRHASITR